MLLVFLCKTPLKFPKDIRHLPLRTSSSTTQPVWSPREVDVAGMTLQTSEGHPGLGTDVFVPQSLQWEPALLGFQTSSPWNCKRTKFY